MRGPSKVRRAHSTAGPKTSLKGSRASSIDDHLAHAEVHAPPVARASSSRLPVLTRRIAVVAKLHRLHRVGLALLGEYKGGGALLLVLVVLHDLGLPRDH